ncbi:TetR/AcrR family transcriptional regulator [Nocardia jejuensis]|uniref:TetR/AcrR family transcriptional regulator n=1 Tax=Nocardia jejuensis TaxID=328049 RepID=UPI00082EE6F5|nr:TetR/AcrR family transcriptional regulator [Nocardia jejuensis]
MLQAAYELCTCQGVRAASPQAVAARSGVAEEVIYQHFDSIEELISAVYERRERLWTFGLLEEQSRCRGSSAEEQLLALFDVLDEWFASSDFDACIFIDVLMEMSADHPLGGSGVDHLRDMRDIVRARAHRAGFADVDDFSRSWHILMKGSVIAAAEGDRHAAHRARKMAVALIAAHRS